MNRPTTELPADPRGALIPPLDPVAVFERPIVMSVYSLRGSLSDLVLPAFNLLVAR